MSVVRKTNFGKKNTGTLNQIKYNLFIGNIIGNLNSNPAIAKTQLAGRLFINESDFLEFDVIGTSIYSRIEVPYTLPYFNGFDFSCLIDTEGYMQYDNKQSSKFLQCDFGIVFYAPGQESLWSQDFAYSNSWKTLYFGAVQVLGGSTGDDGVFTSINNFVNSFFPVALQSANGGAIEGDVLNLRNQSNRVTFLQSVDAQFKPEQPTYTLKRAYIKALEFNISTNSENPVTKYWAWLNKEFKNEIGDKIVRELIPNTSYDVFINAIDSKGNLSPISFESHEVTVSTLDVSNSGLVTDELAFYLDFDTVDNSTEYKEMVKARKANNLGATENLGGLSFDGINDFLELESEFLNISNGTYCFWFQRVNTTDHVVLQEPSDGSLKRGVKITIIENTIYIRLGNNGGFFGNNKDYQTDDIPDLNTTNINLIAVKVISYNNIVVNVNGIDYTATAGYGGMNGNYSWNYSWPVKLMRNVNSYNNPPWPNYSKGILFMYFGYSKILSAAELNKNYNNGSILKLIE